MPHENAHRPDEPEGSYTLLFHIMERNIRTITRLRLQTARERHLQERLADAITAFSGSMGFVYLPRGDVRCPAGGALPADA